MLEQIKGIKPTHIVFCVSKAPIIKVLVGENILKPTGWGCNAGVWNGIKVLDFYHPSARVGSAALYSFLKVNFQELGWL